MATKKEADDYYSRAYSRLHNFLYPELGEGKGDIHLMAEVAILEALIALNLKVES